LYKNFPESRDMPIVVRKQMGALIFAKSYLKFTVVNEGLPETIKDERSLFFDVVGDLESGSSKNHLKTITTCICS
jgi:hypothetical protein